MNARLKILIFVIVGIFVTCEIPANNWHSYLSYYQVIAIAQGGQEIFAANENGLFSYNLTDKSFETKSRVEGLSDSGISAIGWSNSKGALLIGYSNGNLDLLSGNTILNLSDIKLKTSITNRSINNILCDGDFAWLSCDFGIVKINLKKWEVAETWVIGPDASQIIVKELAADDRYFWAATGAGVYKAEKDNPNLQDYHNWILQDGLPFPSNQYNSIAVFNNKVYTCDSNGKIYIFDGVSWQQAYSEIAGIRKIRAFTAALAFVCDKNIEVIGENSHMTVSAYGSLIPTNSIIYPKDALIANSGELWIGDHTFGLIEKNGIGSYLSVVPSSPSKNNAVKLKTSGTNLYIATGKDDSQSASVPAEIHHLKEQTWVSVNEITDTKLAGLKNISNVIPSTSNAEHFWGGTRGDGLIEFDGQKVVKIYNSGNSALGSQNGTCKIGGLFYDATGNLWLTNPSGKNQLHFIKQDGTWKSFSYPGIDNQFTSAGDLIITKANTKWIIVSNSDLFALRTKNTLDDTTDDLYRKTSVRSRFSNGETTIIKGFSQIDILAEDQDGYLWVGTENGVVLYTNPEALFGDGEFYGVQPSVDLGDGIFHPLLENETVNAIVVDGGNRKWFGTTNSGVFLFSADGSNLIHHFNTDNSPLFSNNISGIAINGQNGEVFFATERGLISWSGNATDGDNSFQHLYVWPNPVRETYHGDITIDGLLAGSTVKITDVAGNLVYKTTSLGGRAVWNGKNRNGARVSTGVYLIFVPIRRRTNRVLLNCFLSTEKMLQKTRGIVLRNLKFGDTGIITTIYTESFGRMAFIVQGIHGRKSSVKGNLLKQLFLLEMEVDYKPGRELQRVKEIKNISPFGSIPFGIVKSSQALFLSELLEKVLREEESRPELFEFLFRSIQILDLLEDGVNNFHLLFLIQLTRYLGFGPSNNYSTSNQFFDMIAGNFVLLPPPHPWFLQNRESLVLAQLIEMNYQNSAEFKPDQGLRNILLDFVLEYYGLHIGNKLNLKSLKIFREILH